MSLEHLEYLELLLEFPLTYLDLELEHLELELLEMAVGQYRKKGALFGLGGFFWT